MEDPAKLFAEMVSGTFKGGPDQYILDEAGQPVACPNFYEWVMWMEAHETERHVADDRDEGPNAPDIRISTIFLGLNLRHVGSGAPILWETMIFGGGPDLDLKSWRYSSRDEAKAGHQAACRHVAAALAVRKDT